MTGRALSLRDLLAAFTAERVGLLRKRRWNRPVVAVGDHPVIRECGHVTPAACEHDIATRITCYLVQGNHVTAALGDEARRLAEPPVIWGRLEEVALAALPPGAPSPDVFLLTAGLELSLPWLSLVTA